jgi:hypothetical protein
VFSELGYSVAVLSVHQKVDFLTAVAKHCMELLSRPHWPSFAAVLLQILLVVHQDYIVGKHAVMATASYAQLSPY